MSNVYMNIDVDINFLFFISSKILINVQKQNRLNTKTLEILAWQRSIVQLYLFRLY